MKEEELHPELSISYQIAGNVLLSMGRKEEAVEQFQKGLAREPDNQEILTALVTLRHQEGRYGDAVACLEKATARDAQNTGNLIWLAEDYAHTGRQDKMEAVLARTFTLDDTPESMLRAAELILKAGRPSATALAWTRQAETRLEAASLVPSKGTETTALLARAWTLHGQLNLLDHHPDQALPFLKAAWSLTLESGCGASLAQALGALGQIQEAGRQYELAAAAEDADRGAIGRTYRELMGHALPAGRTRDRSETLAVLRTGRFPWTGARAPVPAVLEVSPAGVEAVHALGEDTQALLPALRQMQWTLVFPDASPRRVFLKGSLEFQAEGGSFRFEGPRPAADRPGAQAAVHDAFQAYNGNRLPEAQAKLDQARRLDPGFSSLYYLQGLVAIRNNDMKGTKAAFQKYLELDGNGEKAGEIRTLLLDPSLKNLR
jgi:tetratricopeptide (TPR) repeat protein